MLSACLIAWRNAGSTAVGDWGPYGVLAALLVATALLSGGGVRPSRAALLGVALLGALAVWATITLAWSPLPSGARDEGLLTAAYALALAAPLLSLRLPEARMAALGIATAAVTGLALLSALTLRFGSSPLTRFHDGRLYFPISYANAQASLFLAAFWPAVVLGARRRAHPAWRAAAVGAATTMAAAALLAQSKGAVLALVASAIVVGVASPARLRVLTFAVLTLAPAVAVFRPLTKPFRAKGHEAAEIAAIRGAGTAVLVAAGVAVVIGLAVAVLDRAFDLTPQRTLIGRVAGGATALALIVGAVVFVASVGSPSAWAQERWDSFKKLPEHETGTTHLTTLGSNRYDFWRVSLDEFRAHPVGGCGARCFGPEYLVRGKSVERPKRAHSLPLEVAAEQGAVGLVLLVGAFGVLLAAAARGAHARRGPAVAALGAATCFLAQASVDWTWTLPAVGIAYLAILGIGLAEDRGTVEPTRARTAGAVAVAVGLLAFAPVWLSARITRDAVAGTASASSLRWARRLDPVSTAPVIAQAVTARTAPDELRLLRKAAKMEPRALEPQYFLGVALLNTGQRAAARAQLRKALALDPRNPSVIHALSLATR